MIRVLLSTIACLLFTCIFLNTGLANARPYDTLQWRSVRVLSWADFRGRADKFSDNDALTKSSIVVSFEFVRPGDINYEIRAVFHYYGSWVKDYAKTDRLLLHEQNHFNITELFARKIRKELSETEYVPGKFKSMLDSIYTKYEREWKSYQFIYDKQTNHGINPNAQKEWSEKVAAELKLYDAFTNPNIRIPIVR